MSIEQSYQLRDYSVVQMGGNRDLDKGGSDGGGKKMATSRVYFEGAV